MNKPLPTSTSSISQLLSNNIFAQVTEILVVFGVALLSIILLLPVAGENIFKQMGVIWVANVLMMIMVWFGIKLRGQSLSDFGVTFGPVTMKKVKKTFLQSIMVFVLAMLAFMLGSIIMANITGIPDQIDTSEYDYIRGNIPMLLLSLAGVYIVSSFGEEFVYRAFLLNRFIEMGLSSRWGKRLAIMMSAIIFGFAHYSWGPMGVVQTGFMGLVLAIFYLRLDKNIWPLVIAHIIMDTILIVQMYMGAGQ